LRPDRIVVGEARGGETLDLVVHMERWRDGTRKVVKVAEVQRLNLRSELLWEGNPAAM